MASKRFLRAWVKALRSGKYRQSRGNLKNDVGYCCLGVACSVQAKLTGRPVKSFTLDKDSLWYSGSAGEWLLPQRDQSVLATMNDLEGKTFSELADYIETVYELKK